MVKFTFNAGVNLGGWLSQYRTYSTEHFDTFITERDLEQIAGWGMDHVRLPIDYPVIQKDEQSEGWNEEGIAYMDRCLEWAKKRGLGVILDLHKAPGYFFGTLDQNKLFTDEALQVRFIQIWQMLAKRYRSEGDYVQLELMNEVVDQDSTRWNKLAHRAIAGIREIDPDRKIVYGGNYYNSIDELENIELVEGDENIIYTFHLYKPMLFTHQKAPWVPVLKAYDRTVDYPGYPENLQSFLEENPQLLDSHTKEYIPERMNRELMESYIQPAADFIGRTGKPLYCGEFGVIEHAPMDSRIRWHSDVTDLFRNLNIGRAVWSYKEMDFGLVNLKGQVINEELVRVLSR